MTPDWAYEAACSRLSVEESARLFFGDYGDQQKARAICATCPVLEACRDEGDQLEPLSPAFNVGIRAGESPEQRAERRRQSMRSAA